MLKKITLLCLCIALVFSCGCSVSDTPLDTQPETKPTQRETAPTQSETTETQADTLPTETEQTVPATEETTAPTQPEETIPMAPVQETPADITDLWIPLCNEFIYLRETPGGNPILKIPVGAYLTLEKWVGKYALVRCGDAEGYVLSNYIKPAEETFLTDSLKIVRPVSLYTYEQMCRDMADLQALYPQFVRIASIGTSELSREIPVLQIGDPDAPYQVLMQGAMHGREHFTACLLMAIADYYLAQAETFSESVCYHIIPMSNPDGVAISQSSTLDEMQTAIYQSDLAAGYTTANPATYANQWKANALGIDLNRNFASGWEVSLERPVPSSEKFRGTEAFSAAESRALRDYTLQYDFDATISVHSHGSVIYYQYGKSEPVNTQSYSLALAAEAATGYTPISYDGTTGAGYKDWAMDALQIPSLTLEIGCYTTPLVDRDIYNTVFRCRTLMPAINTWLQQG